MRPERARAPFSTCRSLKRCVSHSRPGTSRAASAAHGALNETLIIGPVDPIDPAYATAPAAGAHFAENVWPETPAELRPALTRYYRALSEVATTLMRIFALA